MTYRFHPTTLREYDIRGIVGETLGEDDAYAIGRGFATLVRRAGGQRVAVGIDGRESSPVLEKALIRGLNESGASVIRIGLGPTPMLYYAEAELEVDGGIMITGSHNPSEYNGFKMVLQRGAFFGSDIQELGRMAEEGDWEEGSGTSEDADIMDLYVERLLKNFDGGPFRIAWDASHVAVLASYALLICRRLTVLLPHHLQLRQHRRHHSNQVHRLRIRASHPTAVKPSGLCPMASGL